MAWKTVTYELTSDAPMLMHNGQTADPLNKYAKAMKAVSSKRAKTDADYEEMARIEFTAGLYMNGNGPCIPAHVIDAVLVNAAKKVKEGMSAKASVYCPEHADLEYDGPRDVAEMWADERFRHVAAVRVSMARVMRTRPVFREWKAKVTVKYEDSLVNLSQLDRWMEIAGSQIGVGDWRPQHGRFSAKRIA